MLFEGFFFQMPATAEDWLKISEDFETLWQFPNCLGSLDGKHITLQAPFNSGSEYFNYKGFFSIVLFALVDANYNFLYVDIGCQGRISDGGVFRNSELHRRITNHTLELPPPKPLPQMHKDIPYVFVADEAFPLTETIMKPYAGVHPKGSSERIFNFRLSRARRVVENTFGIISSVFRVLRKPLLLAPEKAQLVVMAVACLHNYLKRSKSSSNSYIPPGALDIEVNGRLLEGSWRNAQCADGFQHIRNVPRRATLQAKDIRREFANYFTTTGAISWQSQYA